MKQSVERRGGCWFWVGVVLLCFSALLWLLIILIIATDGDGAGIGAGLMFTAIPIGIGIYSVWRGSRLKVSKETVQEQMLVGEDAEIPLRQEEQIIASHKAGQFSRLSWVIVVAFPIVAIIVAVVFHIIGLSVWLLILALLVAFVIALLLLGLVSKRQASYFEKSSSSDLALDERERDKGTETPD